MKKPVISVERREKRQTWEPKQKWVFPLVVGLAIAVVVGVVIYSIATGVFFP